MDIAKSECNMCVHHTICKYESEMKTFIDRISETISKENTNITGIAVSFIKIECNNFRCPPNAPHF